MAMLLFMICAVLGGIILASATAVSGRVKNLVESDSRYYSVTSAAQLLAKEFSGTKIVIERSRTTHQYTDAAGSIMTDLPAGVAALAADTYHVETKEGKNTYTNLDECSFLAKAANVLLFGSGAENAYGSAGETGSNPTLSEVDTWNATFSTDSADSEEETSVVGTEFRMKLQTDPDVILPDSEGNLCKVQCKVKVQRDGEIRIQIYNLNDDETKHDDEFTVELVMRPDYTETQTDEVTGAVPVSGGGEKAVFDTTKNTTKTSTISWFVLEVEKLEKSKTE